MTDVVVTASDLVLAYGSHVAIDRSSFSIPAGTVTAIIGPNGSGKSTLLNAITGLIAPAAGTIETPGLASTTDISYVLQTTQVNEALPISVKEVVSMGRYASAGAYRWLGADDKAAVASAMERMDITNIATRHLHDLSGGQRQRVFVAQGLAQDHEILLLDEPLTGIDLPTAQAIDKVIHDETTRGCSVIMTTHDLSEAQVADHVLLLSGRVIASGTPSDVLTRDHLVEAYGPSLLHVGEGGQVFLDDPAHSHIPGRHSHRERSIHTEASPSELHGDSP
ncbi:MAG: metal ABC transporter ATP-binding protein [Acidimicrobiia bacterium]